MGDSAVIALYEENIKESEYTGISIQIVSYPNYVTMHLK